MHHHHQHRQRMRERLLRNGSESLADHELLEMLLYGARSRGDTNDIAHALLEEFGSLRKVLLSDVDTLMNVRGVGPQSAVLLKLCLEACRRCLATNESAAFRYTAMSDVLEYLFPKFIGVTHERLYLLLFNNRMNLLDCILVSQGSVTATDFPFARINDIIVRKKAATVLLAHNHPDGLAVPSANDTELTDAMLQYLNSIDIAFLEHLIMTESHFYPILKYRYGAFRPSPVNQRAESNFYGLFYDVEDKEYSYEPTIE